jgi:beta-lactam-binding protein with PASTA domain
VPDVVGKDRFQAEQILDDAGLNYRVRATRPNNELKADTVLFQLPRAGDVVKTGQTVAMDISRTAAEGESSEAVVPEQTPDEKVENQNANDSTNENENKPRRKPANKNENANDNRNANANANRSNRNANRNSNTANSNRPGLVINGNSSGANQNGNTRPPVVKPSPVVPPKPTP